jgi:hypothetical protein
MTKGIVEHPIRTSADKNEESVSEAGSNGIVLEIPTRENHNPTCEEVDGGEQQYPKY